VFGSIVITTFHIYIQKADLSTTEQHFNDAFLLVGNDYKLKMEMIRVWHLWEHPIHDLVGFRMWILGQFSLVALFALLRQCVRMVCYIKSAFCLKRNVISA